MGKHLKYAGYVFRHKFYVALACFKQGLYWRGLTHDMSKFLPTEWTPYAEFFYDKRNRGAIERFLHHACWEERRATI